jgi:hypothetical protein
MENFSCQNCRYWHRLTEPLGECRRRAPTNPPGSPNAAFPGTFADTYCWEWRPTDASEAPAIGRPKLHSVDVVRESLAGMTGIRSFNEVLTLINIQLPMSRSVAYKFVKRLVGSGFLVAREGGFERVSGPVSPAVELD